MRVRLRKRLFENGINQARICPLCPFSLDWTRLPFCCVSEIRVINNTTLVCFASWMDTRYRTWAKELRRRYTHQRWFTPPGFPLQIFPLISRRSFYIFPSPILFLFITRSLSSSLALPLSKYRLILNLMFADPNTSKADRRCLVVLTSMCVNLSSNRLIFQAPIHAWLMFRAPGIHPDISRAIFHLEMQLLESGRRRRSTSSWLRRWDWRWLLLSFFPLWVD